MHAVAMHETGGPDVLRYEEVERPEPGEGEVLIKVHAASVNPIDWKIRQGQRPKPLPAVLGSDVSGTVELSRAEEFAAGDEVFGFAQSGSYAEYATAPAAIVAPKPAGITHEQAAALPVAGLTAWQALFDRGGLKRGGSALVAGAAGGVGHFAVQFAKHAGAQAVGTGSARNRDFVLGLGADEYVDYSSQDVAEVVQRCRCRVRHGRRRHDAVAAGRGSRRRRPRHDRQRASRAGGRRAWRPRRAARDEPEPRPAIPHRRARGGRRCARGDRGDLPAI